MRRGSSAVVVFLGLLRSLAAGFILHRERPTESPATAIQPPHHRWNRAQTLVRRHPTRWPLLGLSPSDRNDNIINAAPPINLQGPLTADGDTQPSVEKGFRYHKDEWWRTLRSLPKSYILYRIRRHLLITTALTSLVTWLYMRFESTRFLFSIPLVGHSLSAGFLSLLLVFRQNSAYARFYEARTLWSDAMAACRMLALDTVSLLRPNAPVAAERLLRLVSAFPDALTYCCLSGRYPLAENVEELVVPRYPVATGTVLQPATVLLLLMMETLQGASKEFKDREPLDNFNLYELHVKVHKLTDIMSSCEKIVKTPVPWSYSRHASRFLTVWSSTLAAAVVSSLEWFTIPVVAVLCWSLFGLEQIGHLLENPFVGHKGSQRSTMTQPYDIGIPVFVLSNQARLEVEGIAALPPPAGSAETRKQQDQSQESGHTVNGSSLDPT